MTDTTIALTLPADLTVALWGRKQRTVEKEARLKALLAMGLFAEGSISLAKAASLADMNRYEFAVLLKQIGLPAYEYTLHEYDQDVEFIESMTEV